MIWLWLFLYLVVGLFVVMARAIRLTDSEAIDVLFAIVGWPVTFVSYPIFRYKRWRREAARQARISACVENGHYGAEYARRVLHWKG